MCLIFAAFFLLLYVFSVSVYKGRITRRKLETKLELEGIKTKSEEERRASIAALYRYYTETIAEAESRCLLWREILRRDRENSEKCLRRNNHIKRLKSLIETVETFMTVLKKDIDDDAYKVTDKDIASIKDKGLQIDVNESFCGSRNKRVYSISDDDASATEKDRKENKDN